MLELTVGPEGNFLTISEALLAVPYNTKATIYIAEGIYQEKIFCEKKNITMIGAGSDKTIISWDDYGKKLHPDGRKYGTFRSYTAFFSSEIVTIKNLTIMNTSGDNRLAGQAIAAYVDAEVAFFDNVHFDSYQDTLFCAPFPDSEREVGGFFGPRMHSPRNASLGFYHNCTISGNVDFIFGGGDALFNACLIISKSVSTKQGSVGYVCAPSGKKEGIGFVFVGCEFTTLNCGKGSVYLARPWREEAKVALVNCYLDDHIHKAGWSAWNLDDSLETNLRTTFVEIESHGPGANTSKRVNWAKQMDLTANKQLTAWIAYVTKLFC